MHKDPDELDARREEDSGQDHEPAEGAGHRGTHRQGGASRRGAASSLFLFFIFFVARSSVRPSVRTSVRPSATSSRPLQMMKYCHLIACASF